MEEEKPTTGRDDVGPDLAMPELRALAEFRYRLRAFMRSSEEAAYAAGSTPQQYQALVAIAGFQGQGSITVGELAERLQVRHHSAVGLVDRLCTQGLVERKTGQEDRRQVHVLLTTGGMRLLARLADLHRAQLRQLLPALSELAVSLGGSLTEPSPGPCAEEVVV